MFIFKQDYLLKKKIKKQAQLNAQCKLAQKKTI